MLSTIAAILPVFMTIFLGVWLKSRDFPGHGFWAPAERLTYFVLFPALIVVTLAKAELAGLTVMPMALAVVATQVLVAAVLVLLQDRLHVDGPGLTSLIQGGVRMNTYVCLAMSAAVWGSAGITVAAIVIAVMVPAANTICVVALARYGRAAEPTVTGILKSLARNPLIVAALAGIALNGTGIHLPPILGPFLEILGRAALPLGLIAVGAALDFHATRASARVIAQNAGTKLFLTPLLGAVVLSIFGVEGLTAAVPILFLASPTATSSYILARQLGGDATLMAGIITTQTAASLITLPIVLTLIA